MNLMSKNPAYYTRSDLSVGEYTYGSPSIHTWGEGAKLHIGNYTSIADGVRIMLGGEHRIDWVTTYPFNVLFGQPQDHPGHPATKGDVVIGNDVWIARDALILSGVTIGDGAVVGARAVVSKDVPPYAVVVGNPMKVIKYRFSPDVIERLLQAKWWDRDINDMLSMGRLLMSPDVEELLSTLE